MKIEFSLPATPETARPGAPRPAMVNEITRPVQPVRREEARDALVRLNILARRQERWDRRAARA